MENWSFDFTPEKLAQCSSRNTDPAALFDALSAVLPRYEINTVDRVAAFLAQCGHESADFTVLHENLNYSAKGLHATWPTRFISEDAAVPYNRNPEAIANKVYSSRLGNGDEASGDGYRYCGRGLIQLTGKTNYDWFAASLEISATEASEYLETFEGAAQSACWFWESNNLNVEADAGDIKKMTKKINGGYIGLDDRIKHYEHALHILGA